MATLFTTKNFNHNALKNFLEKHWKGRFLVSVKERAPNSNLYLAAFHCEGDRRRTILNQQWVFDKCPILLEIPDTDSTLSPETMKKIPFWVQVHNIPFSRRSISLAKLLGRIDGTLLEVHQPSLLETWGSYLRIRIMFDVTKPLPRGIPIMFPGLASPTWLELKYEDIPDHCYYCGRLGHSYPSCTEYMRASDESTQSPPLPYENVLRGTTRQNHGPFGLLPNPFLLNSTSIAHIEFRLLLLRRIKEAGLQPGQSTLFAPHGQHQSLSTQGPKLCGSTLWTWRWRNLLCSVSPMIIPQGRGLIFPIFEPFCKPLMISTSLPNWILFLLLTLLKSLSLTALLTMAIAMCHPVDPPRKKNKPAASSFKRQLDTIGNEQREMLKRHRPHLGQDVVEVVSSEEASLWFLGCRSHESYQLECSIGLSCISVPWCVFGDFNDFLTWEDKSSSNPRNGPSPLFRTFMNKFHLQALHPNGPRLTWTNNSQGNRNTLERLDWAVGNSIWHSQHLNNTLNHLDFFGSDHRAIQLSFNQTHNSPFSKKKNKRFLFENVWLSEPQWNDVLLEAWSSNTPSDDPSTNLFLKQSTCATFLSNWKHKAFFGFQKRIKQAQLALEQARNSQDTSSKSYSRQKALQANLDSLLFKEETYWRQRSRIQWLNLGDKNTRFFHKFASNRKRSNRIDSLTSEDGIVFHDSDSILSLIQSYYSNLFTSQHPHDLDIEAGLSDPLPRIDPSHCQLLEVAFSPSEVKKALFQMGPDKALGKDITEAVLNVLNNLTDISQFNTTLVTLIPKVRKPVSLKDYRPISLCTTIYKIISKVLANRLKLVLSPLISPNQSAFLKSRLISDNILMAQEILHSIKNKKHGRVSWMAVKLDMAKAFDRVEWKFLQKIMEKFAFPTRFIKLIMACITTATFKFKFNGQAMGLVTPSRGIRQGDPLSPYLFLMCAEGLPSILKRAESHEEAFGIKIARTAPKISHLLFADDSILFCNSNIQACNAIKEALDQYLKISGPQVNFRKSSMFFSPNTSLSYQTLTQDYLQIPTTNHLDKYLGLPQCFGRSKNSSFNSLKDRIWSYLSKWQGKLLSKGGKEVLLKAVVQAIPIYAVSVFKLPDSFCSFVEKEMANFWWGAANGQRKLYWKNWKSLCNSKSVGGLGFTALKPFNQAMLAKRAWRIQANQSPLSTQPTPKIRHFSFRLAQNSIPTAENLYHMHCLSSPICPRCHLCYESVQHALFECKNMKKAWSGAFNLFLCMLWKCWNARNAAVFRNQDSNPMRIEQEAHDYLDFYQAAQDKRMTQPQSTTDLNNLAWKPPLVGTLKLNADAAVSSHQNKTGGGVIVRDHTGKVIAATTFSRVGQMQPKAAEGWVLWEGLKWSRDNGLNIDHIEVDCKNLLTDLQSTDDNLSSYGTIINAIRRMLSSLPTVTLHHTRRQGNTAAHNLAQMSTGLDNTWCWNSQDPYPFPL
uniref:Reverse transcriptase domain-containing protein n=1 Tax=Cannabis sativa TaxID=3483 RepID=A0A803NTC1_CANSA